MYCSKCGKEINDEAYICPFCGCKTQRGEADERRYVRRKTNGMAIAGFVCSFLFSLLGLIFSCIALKQCRERDEGGEGLAKAGKIISIVGICLSVFYFIVICCVACEVSSYYYY